MATLYDAWDDNALRVDFISTPILVPANVRPVGPVLVPLAYVYVRTYATARCV